MTTLNSERAASGRAYAGDGDIERIVALAAICDAADQAEGVLTETSLREEYEAPGFDPARQVRLWEDGEGRVVASAEVWLPHGPVEELPDAGVFVWFLVHPEARGAVEDQIVAWGAEHRDEAERTHGRALPLRAAARDVERQRAELLEAMGFEAERYFIRMARTLAGELPEPAFPEGYALRSGPHDPQAHADLYNLSFVDHFDHWPWTEEMVRHHQEASTYRADLDLAVYAPDGTAAAFAWCRIDAEENARLGRSDGHIGLLGVRRGHRGAGLGRATLRAALRALRDGGATEARLGVDAASPTGATRLYESEGFAEINRRTVYALRGSV